MKLRLETKFVKYVNVNYHYSEPSIKYKANK